MSNLYSRFKEWALKQPDHPALVEPDRSLSYGELLELIDWFSQWIPQKETVGIVLDHTIELIALLFAINKNGSLFVPAEPTMPAKRLKEMFSQANVQTVITQKRLEDCFPALNVLVLEELKEKRTLSPEIRFLSEVPENDQAYVLFTSGTTGKPKGVVVRNEGVLNYVQAFGQQLNVTPQDRMIQYSVITFDIFIEETFGTLLNGATLYLPDNHVRKDIEALADYLDTNQISLLSGFPYLAEELNERKAFPQTLRYLISGGDVLRLSQIDRLLDRIPVLNTYGPSETTVCASYYPVKKEEVLEDGTFPIGKPIQNVSMEIWDSENHPVPDGQPGEIIIMGKGVSDGYIQMVKESENFDLSPEKRIYHSGDIGYKIGDTYYFIGRKDRQIMVDGRRVELDEVESVLYQMDGISQAVIITQDHNHHISMVAFVNGAPEKEEIETYLKSLLPDYMVPKIRKIDHIPLNEHGKPDGKALHALL